MEELIAQLFLSQSAAKVLAKAESEADALKDEYVSCEHILIAMAQSEGKLGDVLKKAGVNRNALLESSNRYAATIVLLTRIQRISIRCLTATAVI